MTQKPIQKDFSTEMLKNRDCEFLAYMGQPMLYDGDLYVLREPLKTQWEYYRWVKGVRIA